MDIIYHSIPTTWKKKRIEQIFNYAGSTVKEMTHFLAVEYRTWNQKYRDKSSAAAKKMKD